MLFRVLACVPRKKVLRVTVERECKECERVIEGPWAVALFPKCEEGFCTELCWRTWLEKERVKNLPPETGETRFNRTVKFY